LVIKIDYEIYLYTPQVNFWDKQLFKTGYQGWW